VNRLPDPDTVRVTEVNPRLIATVTCLNGALDGTIEPLDAIDNSIQMLIAARGWLVVSVETAKTR